METKPKVLFPISRWCVSNSHQFGWYNFSANICLTLILGVLVFCHIHWICRLVVRVCLLMARWQDRLPKHLVSDHHRPESLSASPAPSSLLNIISRRQLDYKYRRFIIFIASFWLFDRLVKVVLAVSWCGIFGDAEYIVFIGPHVAFTGHLERSSTWA